MKHRSILSELFEGVMDGRRSNLDDILRGALEDKNETFAKKAARVAMQIGEMSGEGPHEVTARALGLLRTVNKHALNGGTVQFHHPDWPEPKTLKVRLK